MICAACGAENRDGARFCDSCGAPLAVAAPREQRKVVTVLFCDVSGSTALGEQLDPEALRRDTKARARIVRAAVRAMRGDGYDTCLREVQDTVAGLDGLSDGTAAFAYSILSWIDSLHGRLDPRPLDARLYTHRRPGTRFSRPTRRHRWASGS